MTSGHVRRVEALIALGIKVIRQQNKGLAAARNAGILVSEANIFFRSMRITVYALAISSTEFKSWTQTHTLASYMPTRNTSGCIQAVGCWLV